MNTFWILDNTKELLLIFWYNKDVACINILMHNMVSGGCFTVTQDGGLVGRNTEEARPALSSDC